MGLIGAIAAGAALAIKFYKWITKKAGGDGALESVRQQAAVVGTLANVVFAILDALTGLKIAGRTTAAAPAAPTGFGRWAGTVVPTTVQV